MVHYTSNSLSAGFWKVAPQSLGGGEFRLLNNTVTCESPWLVVYREAPPDNVAWGIMPSQWQKNGAVHMMVAKGTLVPDATLTHSAARRLGSSILPAAAAAAVSSDQHEPKRKRRSIVSATAVDVPILFAEESSGASGRSGGGATDLEDLCAACANTSTVPIPEAWYYRSSSLSSSAPSNPASHQGTSTHSTPQDCVTPREDSFDARSSDSYPTTPHGEEPGSLTPRCASTSPVHEDLVQQIMLGEQASSATSAATPRSVLLANLHAAALGARDASLALLAHDATLDEGESARLDGPRIETMARRYALDAQQVEVWMDEAALMGGGGTAAGACAPFIRPLGRGQSAPPQVVDNKTCDNEAAAALLLNQQSSTQSHGLFRSRDKEPSPRAGSAGCVCGAHGASLIHIIAWRHASVRDPVVPAYSRQERCCRELSRLASSRELTPQRRCASPVCPSHRQRFSCRCQRASDRPHLAITGRAGCAARGHGNALQPDGQHAPRRLFHDICRLEPDAIRQGAVARDGSTGAASIRHSLGHALGRCLSRGGADGRIDVMQQRALWLQ